VTVKRPDFDVCSRQDDLTARIVTLTPAQVSAGQTKTL
jgi:hypothetical protein